MTDSSNGVPLQAKAHGGYGRWTKHDAYLADVPAYSFSFNTVGAKQAVDVLPGVDGVPILGSSALREQLNIDIMEEL